MAINTFGGLKTTIADWLNRSDLTAAIPGFVAIAEAKLNRRLRDYRMITRMDRVFDSRFETMPPDWLETARVAISASPERVIEQTTPDGLAALRAGNSDTTGAPTHYAMVGEEIEFWPTPDQAYDGSISYYASITPLDADEDANWLLINAPDVYLYASLVESATYLADTNSLAAWAGHLESAIGAMDAASRGAMFGGPLKMRVRAYG